MCRHAAVFRLTPPFASRSPSSHSPLYLPIPLFYLLGEPASLDQVTYLHRQHQQHQPSRLIQLPLFGNFEPKVAQKEKYFFINMS